MRLESCQGPRGLGHWELRVYPEGHQEPWKCLSRRQHFKSRWQEGDSAVEEVRLEVGRPVARL